MTTRRRTGRGALLAGLVAATALVLSACSGSEDGAGEPPVPTLSEAAERMELVQEYLDGLEEQPLLEEWTGTGAVDVSYDGLRAGRYQDEVILSASAAKPYWVAAAAYLAGTAKVQPYVSDIFTYSDNVSSGKVIGIVGIDRVNEWTRSIGMDSTFLAQWVIGGGHVASDRAEYGDVNVTTVNDAVTFLDYLVSQSEAGDQTATQILEWMQKAPVRFTRDTTYGAALVHELPLEAASEASHKAGWLLPGASSNIQNNILGIGVIPLPTGETYSVAIEAQDGLRYNLQAAGIARVSRGIYEILAGVTTDPVLVLPTLPTPEPRPSTSRSSGTTPGGTPSTTAPAPTAPAPSSSAPQPTSPAPAPSTSNPTPSPSTSSPPPDGDDPPPGEG